MDLKRIGFVVLLTMIIVSPLKAVSFRDPLSQSDRITMHSAIDYRKIGDTSSALHILEPLRTRYPEHPRVTKLYFTLLSSTVSDSRFYQTVRNHFQSVDEPDLFITVVDAGPASDKRRFRTLRWAVKQFSRDEQLWVRTVTMANDRGHDTFVLEQRDMLLNRFPRNARFLELYANRLAEKEEWDRAATLYRRLMSVRPGYRVGYLGLARYYRREGQSDRAQELMERGQALTN